MKQAKTTPVKGIKRVRVTAGSALAKPFRMTVIGNYLPDASHLMRGPLTRRILTAKNLVTKELSRPLQVVLPAVATGIGALATRCANSARLPVVTETDMTEDQYNAIDLVLKVKLVPDSKCSEELVERLQTEYDNACDAWAGNDKVYELSIKVTAAELNRQADLNKPMLTVPKADQRLDYGPFSKIKEWSDQITTEGEETFKRDSSPAYGPGIVPDANKAGGLQNT